MRSNQALRREYRLAVTALVVLALVAPVLLDRDSFPLSTYPMYSGARGTHSTLVTAYGIDKDGERRGLTPTLIGASDDPLVVAGRLRAALASDRVDVRCSEIAQRVSRRPSLAEVVSIEVVSERHDTVARTRGEASLSHRDVHAICEVERA
jgi:hypothetical protein